MITINPLSTLEVIAVIASLAFIAVESVKLCRATRTRGNDRDYTTTINSTGDNFQHGHLLMSGSVVVTGLDGLPRSKPTSHFITTSLNTTAYNKVLAHKGTK